MSDDQNGAFRNYLEVYKIYRSYVMDESTLITARVQWIIQINALMFAGVALLLTKRFDLGFRYFAMRDLCDFAHNRNICDFAHLAILRSGEDALIAVISLVAAIINKHGYDAIFSAKTASETIGNIFDDPRSATRRWHNGKELRREDDKTIVVSIEHGFRLPHVRGGGNKVSASQGHEASIRIPFLFKYCWFVLFLVGIFDIAITYIP